LLTAITRELSAAIGNCELTFVARSRIDAGLASQQHQQYQAVLSSLGCELVTLPAEPKLADSVFIEDTAIVLDEVAVLCRPGVESRRPEVRSVEDLLKKYSTRSNQSGIDQLSDIVADYGFSVQTVEVTKCLHLKSAVSAVAPDLLLLNPDWIDGSAFSGYELIEVDREETHAANALPVGRRVVYPSSFPHTMEKLVARGIDVIPVDISELQKAEGAVTCCSLIFKTP